MSISPVYTFYPNLIGTCTFTKRNPVLLSLGRPFLGISSCQPCVVQIRCNCFWRGLFTARMPISPRLASKIFLISSNILIFSAFLGYARIFAAIGAFGVATTSPYLFFVLYSVSQLLDAFDGHAARYFDQCTRMVACR